jgi:hypothetical protein
MIFRSVGDTADRSNLLIRWLSHRDRAQYPTWTDYYDGRHMPAISVSMGEMADAADGGSTGRPVAAAGHVCPLWIGARGA